VGQTLLTLAKHLQRWALLAATACLAAVWIVGCAAGQTGGEDHDYRVLLIGNSHSSRGGLPERLQALLAADGADRSAYVRSLGHWAFLADRLNDNVTQEALESGGWTHVILQAQKYSTSGRYTYPTAAAEEWIRRIRARGAVPILFPEWARRDHPEETLRILRLHLGIASREPACVAAVGLAWDAVRQRDPAIQLHASDGNHANRRGALLTAYVLYNAITGKPPDELDFIETRGIPADSQGVLRSAAGEATRAMPGCQPDSAS